MTISLQVWRVRPDRVPAALWRMAVDRGRLRRTPAVSFAKLLGTGRASQFGVARADLTRWAALTVSDGPAPELPQWARIAVASCRIDLRPLASRGSWAGRDPFAPHHPSRPTADQHQAERHQDEHQDDRDQDDRSGPVLALTRARLRPGRAVTFWRAIDPVAAALAGAPGLLAAFGIGEAPLGWQGTISVWRRPTDLNQFAYRHPEHRRAIERTAITGWYVEELFARFAVQDVMGDTGVMGWVQDQRSASGSWRGSPTTWPAA